MIYKVEKNQRNLAAFDVPGATVQVPIPLLASVANYRPVLPSI